MGTAESKADGAEPEAEPLGPWEEVLALTPEKADIVIAQSQARLATKTSDSTKLRTEGNLALGHAYRAGVGTTGRRVKLESSYKLYNGALGCARNDDDHATALKAVAFSSARLAMHDRASGDTESHLHYFRESVKCACRAAATQSKPASWRVVVQNQLSEFVALSVASTRQRDTDDRIRILRAYIGVLGSTDQAGYAALALADILFKNGIRALEAKEFVNCQQQMEHALQALRQVARVSKPEQDVGELLCRAFSAPTATDKLIDMAEHLSDDIHHHLAICESVKCRDTGVALEEKLLKEAEELQVDMMWEVADWYKQAILKTRERDIENEVKALARLAFLFDKVLGDPIRARQSFATVIKLGLSMEDVRSFEKEEWWKTCQQRLREIREAEEEVGEPELLKKLEPLFAKIQAAAAGTVAGSPCGYPDKLLKFLYAELPPKRPSDGMKDGKKQDKSEKRSLSAGDFKDDAFLAKAMKRALLCYAADKNGANLTDSDGKPLGQEWYLTCVEIWKHLNAAYFEYVKK